MSQELSFFVVWCPTGGSPTVRHSTKDLANAEAERLARANPGSRFYVLLATRFVERSDIRIVELDDLPF
jgi:hypothetical protein